jgi:ketosteroid isomerase-like protein
MKRTSLLLIAARAATTACADDAAPYLAPTRAMSGIFAFFASNGDDGDVAAQATADMRADRASLLAADGAHAAATATGLTTGFPRALAPDAVLLWPMLPVTQGRDAVIALIEHLPAATQRRMTWHPVRADVSSDGTRGYTAGYGERTGPVAPDSARLSTTPMRYAAFWTKDAAGQWRVKAWVLVGGDSGSAATAPRGCESPSYDGYVSFPRRDPALARAELIAVDASFSEKSEAEGGGPAFGAYVADDGAMLGGEGEMTCGRSAVAKALSNTAPGVLTWEPRIADVAPSGDLGFTVGVATIHGRDQTRWSKYLTVWKRQRDGEWRFVSDGGNPAPAP